MGARANVLITEDGKEGVYLYTHWGAGEVVEDTVNALQGTGRGRLGDPTYLARIILNYLQKGDDGETGFGISAYPAGDAEIIVIVNTKERTVTVDDQDHKKENISWTFDEILADDFTLVVCGNH